MTDPFSTALQTLERDMQRLTTEHQTDDAREKALKNESPKLKHEVERLKQELKEKESKLKADEQEANPLHLKILRVERDLEQKHREFNEAKQRIAKLALDKKATLR